MLTGHHGRHRRITCMAVNMDEYVTTALDTLKELCSKPHDGEDKTFNENADRLRAAEAILQHARERNVQVSFTGHVPVRPVVQPPEQVPKRDWPVVPSPEQAPRSNPPRQG